MSDSLTDDIARAAARLVLDGHDADLGVTIRAAAEGFGVDEGPLPSHGLVRRHIQAMRMEAEGAEAYASSVHDILVSIEELMTVLVEMGDDDIEPLLVGRAAAGHFDGPGRLHVRAYTTRSIGDLAEILVSAGYAEPRFETADTRHGPLNRLIIEDEAGTFIVTRCQPALRAHADTDLFTGERIEVMDVVEVRRRVARKQ